MAELESDSSLSAQEILSTWLSRHSAVLSDPWEGSEWEDNSPVDDDAVVIDPTIGKGDYHQCERSKRYNSLIK